MSASFRTPLKRAAGLGSAHEGARHFIAQRVTAIALLALAPWFVWSLVTRYRAGFESATAWLSEPLNAIAMILLLSVALHHMRIGMQVIVEDYIARHATRAGLLMLNTFLVGALWAASVFSVLKIALAP